MAATPPLPALEVATAAFFHLDCRHPQLFQPEYKRSNRTKGLKILRCFPHCCPEHIDRSYCGTSLSVRVELAARTPKTAAARTNPPPSDVLAVFARFEAVIDVSLRPGECVEVAKMVAGTQSDSNLEGQWVAGTLDRPSGLVTVIRTPGTPSDDHKPIVFHLNGKPFSRWYYEWESGANKAQRLTKHVLKAYVVEHCAVDECDNFTAYTSRYARTQLYRVLHVVVSPEFTVISYRRAPTEPYEAALLNSREHALQAGGASVYAGASSHRLDPASRNTGRANSISHSSAAKRAHFQPPIDARPVSSTNEEYEMKQSHASSRSAYPPSGTEISDLLEDKLRWEYANLPSVSVSRNLALVYSFLRWAPLSAYTSFVDEVAHLVQDRLLEFLTPSRDEVSKLNCFSKFLLEQTRAATGTAVASSFVHGRRSPGSGPSSLPRELGLLLRVMAQTTRWFYSTETRQWLRAFFRQYAGSVLDKHALRACFVLFVQELQDQLNTHVFSRTELRNLDNTAEEVISAVYSYDYFHARRARVRDIMSGQNFAGWNAFVAQMRETYINVSTCPGVPRGLARNRSGLNFDLAHPPQTSVESAWNAEWLLDVDEAVWKTSREAMKEEVGGVSGIDDVNGAVSLITLFEVISHIVRLEVALDVQGRTLYTRSTQGVAGPLDCMRLVLDSKERVFSMFPNGLASGVDAGRSGDYVGEMRVEQSGRLVVYLQFFNWSAGEDSPSHHVRARIECWRSRRLCISGDVLATTAPASFSSEEATHVGEMPLRAKREAVRRSFVQQLRADPAARWAVTAASPWREVGRFRLSYLEA